MVVVDKKRKAVEAAKKAEALAAKREANLKKKAQADNEAEKVKAKSAEDTFVTQSPVVRDRLCNEGGFHVCRITINEDNRLADFTFFESKKLIDEFLGQKKGGE